MMKKTIFFVFGILAIVSSLFGETGSKSKKPVVAIATFEAKDVEDDDIKFVMHSFTTEFIKLGVATVVDRKNFDKIMSEQSFQISDWADKNKVADLGKALGADLLVVGQVMRRNSSFFLTVKILDMKTTTIVVAHLDKVKSIDDFFEKMPEFCKQLIANKNQDI